MVTLEKLKPYHILAETDYVRIYLESDNFKIASDGEIYRFVPAEAKEIKINRLTHKIENTEAIFAFERKDSRIYISMNELINIPDFLIKIYLNTKAYFQKDKLKEKKWPVADTELVVSELERMNIRRLIDKALDERDEQSFYTLLKLL